MKISAGSTALAPLSPVSLRPEQPADEAFLYAVFASTRADELVLTNWDTAMRKAFLDQQFSAMRQGYRSMFPAGEFLIIEVAGRPAGRMVLDRGTDEIRVVDLALLPAQRNQGVGTLLMRQVCAAAEKPVRLCVLKHNRALQWYARLGFKPIGERGFYDELEWLPATKPRLSAG
jgi:ribosomal protein S18 acetylase RimI-like enzyme